MLKPSRVHQGLREYVQANSARLLTILTAACLIGGLTALLLGVPRCGLPGSDDAIHAVSALRMAEALQALSWQRFWDEFIHPYKYPPLGRLAIALGFLSDGYGWSAPRVANSIYWVATVALTASLAHRVAVDGTREIAAFFTVVFGLSCSLGVYVARTTLLEICSTLVAVLGCHAYLYARDRRSRKWAVATGTCLVASMLVKYSYGPLLLGAIGLSAVIDVARPGPDRVAMRFWAWTLGTVFIGLAWWFVFPFPSAPAIGAAHWTMLSRFFTDATSFRTGGPQYVVVAWCLMSCVSLVGALVQFAGLTWGLRHWRHPGIRVCTLITLAGLSTFVLFPYRLDRCLIPSLFGGWVLGGCLCALVIKRISPPWRVATAGLLLISILTTAGLGSTTLIRLTQQGPWTTVRQEAVERAVATWRQVYTVRPAPDPPPPGTQDLLDRVVALMGKRSTFGWIGEPYPYNLVRWRIFEVTRDWKSLYPRRSEASALTLSAESSFRAWADEYDLIIYFDAAHRKRTSSEQYKRWIAGNHRFRLRAQEQLIIRQREFELLVWERIP